MCNLRLLDEAGVIGGCPAAHPTFCSLKLFTTYRKDASKQGREELVSLSAPLSPLEHHISCCWKNKTKCTAAKPAREDRYPPSHPSLPSLHTHTHSHTHTVSPPGLSGPLTSLHSGSCSRETQDPKIETAVHHLHLSPPSPTSSPPLLPHPLALFLPSLLRLILKAQHSPGCLC